MVEILDDKGQIINIAQGGKVQLMIPIALRKTAIEITESKLRSGTANNDTNYFYYEGNVDVVVNPWIAATGNTAIGSHAAGSDTGWALVSKSDHQLNLFIRKNLDISQERDFDTDTLKIKAKEAFAYGWSDYRGTYFSKGDATSYAS